MKMSFQGTTTPGTTIKQNNPSKQSSVHTFMVVPQNWILDTRKTMQNWEIHSFHTTKKDLDLQKTSAETHKEITDS